MNELQAVLATKVSTFVADIRHLAIKAVLSALSEPTTATAAGPAPVAPKAKASGALVAAAPAKAQSLDKRLTLYVEHNPGAGGRQITEAMGGAGAAAAVRAAMNRLRDRRYVVKRGQTRASRYFPAYEGVAAKVK